MIRQEISDILNHLMTRVKTVRRRLILREILKITAAVMLGGMAFIAAYAWADHHWRFNTAGRITACSLLLIGAATALVWLIRSLLRTISCRRAAAAIENKFPLYQQLTTVVEYNNARDNYPYSEQLAEYLIRQVADKTKKLPLENTVPKRWMGLYAAIIVLGLLVGGKFLSSNLAFVSRYWTRLTNPAAPIAPISPTKIETLTGSLTVEPDTQFTLEAKITGKIPPLGSLTITPQPQTDPANPDNPALSSPAPNAETITLQPRQTPDSESRLTYTRSLPAGNYQYYFAADDAQSEINSICVCSIPGIRQITAQITPQGKNPKSQPTQTVQNSTLDVPPLARIRLTVQTTENIKKVDITDLDGRTETQTLFAKDTFDLELLAAREGFLRFVLVSKNDVTNDKLPALQIRIKQLEPPKLTLISPAGDYPAANVASIPIVFENSDDSDIASAALHLEITGRTPVEIPLQREKKEKTTQFACTLELEDYNLNVGDSILFYPTIQLSLPQNTSQDAKQNSPSLAAEISPPPGDIHFIEIRPYRQLWQPWRQTPVTADNKTASPNPQQNLEKLITLLEYTRAFLKKTWGLAQLPSLAEDDKKLADAIRHDIEYTADQLQRIQNTAQNLTETQNHSFKTITNNYTSANESLTAYNAKKAVPPEKQAYQTLRQLVVEREKECLPGGGKQPNRPDRLVVQENPHLRRYEQERINEELKQCACKLKEIQDKQNKLKNRFEHFLAEDRTPKPSQNTTDESSRPDPGVKFSDKTPDGKSPENLNDPANPQSERPRFSLEGAKASPPPALQSQASGNGAAGSSGTPTASQTTTKEQMDLLRARQNAIQKEIENLQDKLNRLPAAEPQNIANSSKNTAVKTSGDNPQNHREQMQRDLQQAIQTMNQFEKQLSDAYFASGKNRADALKAAQNRLEEIENQLKLAAEHFNAELPLNDNERLAGNAEIIAKSLARVADAYDKSVDERDKNQMLADLDAARKLLEQVPANYKHSEPAQDEIRDSDSPAERTPGGGSGGGSGNGPAGAGLPNQNRKNILYKDPAVEAQLLARQFWTIAIHAGKKSGKLAEPETGNPEFYPWVNQFYELAAAFDSREIRP